MAQRSRRRVSGGLEGRSERPATGYGEPEAGAQETGHDRLKPVLRYLSAYTRVISSFVIGAG